MRDGNEKPPYDLNRVVEVNSLESRQSETDTGSRVALSKRDDFESSGARFRHRDLGCEVKFWDVVYFENQLQIVYFIAIRKGTLKGGRYTDQHMSKAPLLFWDTLDPASSEYPNP